MKMNVSLSDFVAAFEGHGRGNSFSYGGFEALYDFLEENSPDMDFDPVALDCDFCEYDTAVSCVEDLGCDVDLSFCSDEDEKEDAALGYLQRNTTVIEFYKGIIILSF